MYVCIYIYLYIYICIYIYCFGLNTVKDTFRTTKITFDCGFAYIKSEAAVLSFPSYSCSNHFWKFTRKIGSRVLFLVKVRFRQNRLAGSVPISINY